MLWPYEISHFTLAEVCNIPLFDLFGGANKSIEKRNDIYNICIICLPLGNNKSFPHHERWRPLVLQVDGGGPSPKRELFLSLVTSVEPLTRSSPFGRAPYRVLSSHDRLTPTQ